MAVGASDSDATLGLGRSGRSNQTHWQVDAGADHTALPAQLLTLHEWSHNELNNVSTGGCLLTVFAQLALHAKTNRERYRHVLHALVERSRRAHEVYATWYSTDMLSMRTSLPELLTEYPPEYVGYFEAGNRLVQHLDRPFLRQQAFLCTVRICFSGAALAQAGRNLAEFAVADVDDTLYPSALLDVLTEALPSNFFDAQLVAFFRHGESPAALAIIRAACAETRRAAEFFPGVDPREADDATMALHRWFHGRLAELLAARGVECVPYGQHLDYFAQLLPQLTRLCGESVTHPLVANTQPHDNAANLLLHMENEVLRIRPKPLPCVLRAVTEIPAPDWTKLATGDPAHLFFCVRHPSQILAQHEFSKEDRERLASTTEPLVAVRRKIRVGESARCEMFLFDHPDALRDFRRATNDLSAYASISMSVLGNADWCDRWLGAVTGGIVGTVLFDQSVFHTLKDGWLQHPNVRFCKGVLNRPDGRRVFLVFLCESKDGTYALYLTPCGELFMRAVFTFIRQKLPPARFVYDETFMRELDWLLPTVVGHLVAEEHSFSFNHVRFV